MRLRQRIAIIIIALVTAGTSFGFEDKGFQWWSYIDGNKKIADDWRVSFKQEFRTGDDGGNLYYEASDIFLTYSGLCDWLDIAVGYRLVYEKDNSDEWRHENRPMIDLTLKAKFCDFPVASRNRFEYRDFENKKDVWRYSNKIIVRLPVELTSLKLKPYTGYEFFITLVDDNVDKNRIYFGTIMPVTKGIDADIYYIYQTNRSGEHWDEVHVLGTGLKFEF